MYFFLFYRYKNLHRMDIEDLCDFSMVATLMMVHLDVNLRVIFHNVLEPSALQKRQSLR